MRRRLAAAALGALIAGAGLVATPVLVRRVAEARLERALGAASIGAASVGWGNVTLETISVAGLGSVDRVVVDAGPLELWLFGRRAVEEIRVVGCRLDIDLSGRGRPRSSALPEDGEPAPLLSVVVEDCSAVVSDAEGALVTVASLEVAGPAANPRVTARDVTLGDVPALAAREIVVTLAREGGRWVVAAIALDAPHARSGAVLTGLRARVARALGSRAEPSEADGAAAPDTGDGDGLARMLGRLGAAVTVNVHDGVLEGGTPSATLLEDLEIEIARRDAVRFATSGSGRPPNGGAIDWDLVITSDPASASGSLDATSVPLSALTPFLPEVPAIDAESALIDASIELEAADPTSVHGHGSVRIAGLALEHARLAPAPVRGIGVTLRGSGAWVPADQRLDLAELAVEVGGATGTVRGAVEWAPDHYLFDLHAALPSTDCQLAVHAIPADLLGDLTELDLEGRIAGELEVRVDSRDLDATTLRVVVADQCRFVHVPASIDPTRFLGPFTHRVVESDGDEFSMETGPGTDRWTPLAAVSPFLVHAVLAHEDASFFRHHGFAPWAIRDALVRNLRERRYVLGASTITMQLVKNVFLHREKTLARKIQEVLLTWWVESVMSKEQILELYLNVIELGPAVYGIRAGAEHWFGREPAELSVAEAAYLACILPNPSVFAAEHGPEGAPPASFRRRMRSLIRHLGDSGRIDADALDAGLRDLETLTFHASGSPRPEARVPTGHAAALPIEGWGGTGSFADEAEWLDSAPAHLPEDDSDPAATDLTGDRAALDDTIRGWEEVGP